MIWLILYIHKTSTSQESDILPNNFLISLGSIKVALISWTWQTITESITSCFYIIGDSFQFFLFFSQYVALIQIISNFIGNIYS